MKEIPYPSKLITERSLQSWIRCKRKAWLDRNGDQKLRVWSAHRTLQLDHQQRSFYELTHGDNSHGFKAFEQGAQWVRGIRLKGFSQSGHYLETHPPLLQKVKGNSVWGDFAYRPVFSRQGKRITREIKYGLAFASFLLEKVQNSPVMEGLIVSLKVNGCLEKQHLNIKSKLHEQLNKSIDELANELLIEEKPPITDDRKKCSICSWRSVCMKEAKSTGHLTQVNGIGSKRIEILRRLNIYNIENLASSKNNILREGMLNHGEKNEDVSFKIIEQANVILNGKPKRIGSNHCIPEINNVDGFLIYDIESDPDAKEDFLHGFLIVKKNKKGNIDITRTRYNPLLITDRFNTYNSWNRIYKNINKFKGWPIFHYGETEKIVIRAMARKYKLSQLEINQLCSRMIDLHSRLKKTWLLPINSYGLKSVAKWIGFNWSQKQVEGANAILWWRQFKDKKVKNKQKISAIKRILNYNKDDCIATLKVLIWLSTNK